MAVKLPNLGNSLRGPVHISGSGSAAIIVPPSGATPNVHCSIFHAFHSAMASAALGGTVDLSSLKNLVTAVRNWNSANPTLKPWDIRVRVEFGINSTAALLAVGAGGGAGGTGWTTGMPITSSGTIAVAVTGVMPVYFDPAVCLEYQNFVTQLGAYCDSIPEIRMVLPGLTMLFFGEVFWRMAGSVNGSINNNTNYHKAMAATPNFGLTSIATGSNTLTQIDFIVMKQMLDIHAIAHPNTYTLLDTNAYNNVDPLGSTATSGQNFAQQMWSYFFATYPGQLFAITNASGDLNTGGSLYSAMQALGPKGTKQAVLSIQTYPAAKLASLATAAGMTVAAYRAAVYARFENYGMSSIELPDTSDPQMLLASTDAALIANGPTTSGATAPAKPTGVTLTPGHLTLGVTWTDGASNGATVDDYRIQYRTPTGSGAFTTLPDNTTVKPQTIGSLTDGSAYDVQVSAHNSAGWGAYSTIVSATPNPTVAGAPTITGTPGNAQVDIGITAPGSTGGSAITDYTLQRKTTVAGTWAALTHAPDPTAADIIDLTPTNNISYDYRCAAVNGNGTGPWSNIVTEIPTAGAVPPAVVTSIVVYPGDGVGSVVWAVPLANGAAIDKYEATPYQGVTAGTPVDIFGIGGAAPIPGCDLSGLADGLPYTVQVKAHNSAGWGTAGVSGLFTPAAAPVVTPPVTVGPTALSGAAPRITPRWAAVLANA